MTTLVRRCAFCGLPSRGPACVAHVDVLLLDRYRVELAALEAGAGEEVRSSRRNAPTIASAPRRSSARSRARST